MSCEKYLAWMCGHLDEANSESEEKQLQEHLASCADCRVIFAQMQENDAALSASKLAPPADLAKNIMEQVRKEPKKRRRSLSAFAVSGIAAAALLALVLFGKLKLPSHDFAQEGAQETAAAFTMQDALSYRAQTPEVCEAADEVSTEAESVLKAERFSESPEAYAYAGTAGSGTPIYDSFTTTKGAAEAQISVLFLFAPEPDALQERPELELSTARNALSDEVRSRLDSLQAEHARAYLVTREELLALQNAYSSEYFPAEQEDTDLMCIVFVIGS